MDPLSSDCITQDHAASAECANHLAPAKKRVSHPTVHAANQSTSSYLSKEDILHNSILAIFFLRKPLFRGHQDNHELLSASNLFSRHAQLLWKWKGDDLPRPQRLLLPADPPPRGSLQCFSHRSVHRQKPHGILKNWRNVGLREALSGTRVPSVSCFPIFM